MSHLPSATHVSVKHAHLSTPPSSSPFIEDVIYNFLTQVKDDSRLSLLKNLSSLKGGKQLASTAYTLGHHRSSSSFIRGAFHEARAAPDGLLPRHLPVSRRLPSRVF